MKNKITAQINQNQFDALLSHTYNMGGSNTLFSLINQKAVFLKIRDWPTSRYIMADGKVLNGIIKRRKAQVDLFFI